MFQLMMERQRQECEQVLVKSMASPRRRELLPLADGRPFLEGTETNVRRLYKEGNPKASAKGYGTPQCGQKWVRRWVTEPSLFESPVLAQRKEGRRNAGAVSGGGGPTLEAARRHGCRAVLHADIIGKGETCVREKHHQRRAKIART